MALTVGLNEAPVPCNVPADEALYQLTVPVQPEAVTVAVPVPQRAVETTVGADGVVLTVTETVAVAVQPLPFETVTVYVPELAVVILLILGLIIDEVKAFGPFHEYVPPPVAEKLIVPPVQFVVVLIEALAVGLAFTTTFAVAVAVQPFEFVTVTV